MRTLKAHDGPVCAVAYLPDGRLVSAGWDQTVAVWDRTSEHPSARQEFAHPVLAVAAAPVGATVAVGEAERLSLWSVGADPIHLTAPSVPPLALAWLRDGALLAGVNGGDGFNLYDTGARRLVPQETPARPLALGFDDAGELLLVTNEEVLLGRPGQGYEHVPRPFDRLLAGCLSSGGRHVALGGQRGALAVLDRTTGEYRELVGHPGNLLGLTFSRDGRLLLSACLSGQVRLWEVGSWREVARYDWGISAIRAVAFAPDGMTAVAAGFEGELLVWDLD